MTTPKSVPKMAALAALQLMWCMAASAADENEAQSATSPATAQIEQSPRLEPLAGANRRFARQPSGPLATAQDMKVFGTAITEFPAPILLPAPGSYQASCVNISQLHVALQSTSVAPRWRAGGAEAKHAAAFLHHAGTH